jgi:hypothetical protein
LITVLPNGLIDSERPGSLGSKITAWVSRKHPELGKKQVLLNFVFVDWQRGQAARILSDFEL